MGEGSIVTPSKPGLSGVADAGLAIGPSLVGQPPVQSWTHGGFVPLIFSDQQHRSSCGVDVYYWGAAPLQGCRGLLCPLDSSDWASSPGPDVQSRPLSQSEGRSRIWKTIAPCSICGHSSRRRFPLSHCPSLNSLPWQGISLSWRCCGPS